MVNATQELLKKIGALADKLSVEVYTVGGFVRDMILERESIDIDFVVELALEPIKNQLKRDLIKYETKIEKRSESGSLGNLKRYYLDIYKRVESKEITLKKGLELAKTRKTF